MFLLRPLAGLVLLLAAWPAMAAPAWTGLPAWGQAFERADVEGTLLVYDEQGQRWLVHDADRARQAYIPASTFKLFNALVALESGAVKDAHEVIRWDGKVRSIGGKPVAAWNRDNSLASGMRYSTIWFYQEVARRAGAVVMQSWVDRADYGNHDIGGGIDRFWLDGRLRISAAGQIAFLRRLADGTLPFSASTQEAVRRISIMESQPGYVLHAKSGWAGAGAQDGSANRPASDLGWYVGWVESQGRRWFFALNIDMRKDSDHAARMSLVKQLLGELGALPQNR